MRLGKPTMRFHVFPRSWQGYQDSCHWVVIFLYLTPRTMDLNEKSSYERVMVLLTDAGQNSRF